MTEANPAFRDESTAQELDWARLGAVDTNWTMPSGAPSSWGFSPFIYSERKTPLKHDHPVSWDGVAEFSSGQRLRLVEEWRLQNAVLRSKIHLVKYIRRAAG
jgi:hypothetical protein